MSEPGVGIGSSGHKAPFGNRPYRFDAMLPLDKYVKITRKHGFPADYRMEIGTDVVETATAACEAVAVEFPRAMVFAGKLFFQEDNLFHKVLHNGTAFAIQGWLQWMGITAVILPIGVMEQDQVLSRLNVIRIGVPPLRDHPSDVGAIARRLLLLLDSRTDCLGLAFFPLKTENSLILTEMHNFNVKWAWDTSFVPPVSDPP
jgi:hypothetical protein